VATKFCIIALVRHHYGTASCHPVRCLEFCCGFHVFIFFGKCNIEVNYCLPFARARQNTRKVRIVDVAADTATEYHPNSCHLPICVSEYSRVNFQHYFVSVKFDVVVKHRHRL